MAKNKQDLSKFEVVLNSELNNKLMPLILLGQVKSRRCVCEMKSTCLQWQKGVLDWLIIHKL
jgi:hypothetical protein